MLIVVVVGATVSVTLVVAAYVAVVAVASTTGVRSLDIGFVLHYLVPAVRIRSNFCPSASY